MPPSEAIDEYHKLGYSALSITDHNMVTWPWREYERKPELLNMIAIQGSEASRHHHMGVYFCDVPGGSSVSETLEQTRKQRGLAIMFHPGRYRWTPKDYAVLFREWSELIGMEVFNQGDRYPDDRQKWDQILSILMPEGRPVWGFSNDDMHNINQLGRNGNVLLVSELSTENVRKAMEQGVFFFIYSARKDISPPVINSIEADSEKGFIRITASGYEKIEWISNGEKVHEGEIMDLSSISNVSCYVRAILYGANGFSLTGTQPFGIKFAESVKVETER